MKRFVYSLWFTTLIACSTNPSQQIKEPPRFNQEPTLVKTLIASLKPLQFVVSGSGKVTASNRFTIFSPTTGTVVKTSARNGGRAQKGDTILSYDLGEALLTYQKAEVEYLRSTLDYRSQLLGYGPLSSTISDSLKLSVRILSGLASAELQLRSAKLQLEKHTILSPVNGIFSDVKISHHSVVQQGDELMTLHDPDNLFLTIDIIEADAMLLRGSEKAKVSFVASPTKESNARVVEINPKVDERGMVSVKLRLSNCSGLFPGMNATCNIFIEGESTLAIPKQAIVQRNGRKVVFIAENGYAKWAYVNTGIETDTDIQVIDGINAGQKIVVSNNVHLNHESPITESTNN